MSFAESCEEAFGSNMRSLAGLVMDLPTGIDLCVLFQRVPCTDIRDCSWAGRGGGRGGGV